MDFGSNWPSIGRKLVLVYIGPMSQLEMRHWGHMSFGHWIANGNANTRQKLTCGPFYPFLDDYPNEVCSGSFAGTDGRLEIPISGWPALWRTRLRIKLKRCQLSEFYIMSTWFIAIVSRWFLENRVIGSRNASRGNGLRMVATAADQPILGFKLPSAVG